MRQKRQLLSLLKLENQYVVSRVGFHPTYKRNYLVKNSHYQLIFSVKKNSWMKDFYSQKEIRMVVILWV